MLSLSLRKPSRITTNSGENSESYCTDFHFYIMGLMTLGQIYASNKLLTISGVLRIESYSATTHYLKL